MAVDKEGFPILDGLDLAQEASTSHLDQLQVKILLVHNSFSQTCMERIDCTCTCLADGFQRLRSKCNQGLE